MCRLAIIGGTGLTRLAPLRITRREVVHTPYGEPSGPLTHGLLNGVDVVFLPRHGYAHRIPPHMVNYRANWGRAHTFFEKDLLEVRHVDFSQPYCEDMRKVLINAAGRAGIDAMNHGVYGATQGPRLETAAEIDRLERDGCDMVGMTGMPEAALARELELNYVTCAISANWAAGRGDSEITMDMTAPSTRAGSQSSISASGRHRTGLPCGSKTRTGHP